MEVQSNSFRSPSYERFDQVFSLTPTAAAQENSGAESQHNTLQCGVLSEHVIPTSVHIHGDYNGTKVLRVCLRMSRNSTGLIRVISLQLTDPSDPFFLFDMELSEEMYADFKAQLELVVDFNGFPRYLMNILQRMDTGELQYQMTFTTKESDATHGLLRIVERTSFRTIEHISLSLARQGDKGQKRHLAERFQHFEAAFKKCSGDFERDHRQLSTALAAANREVTELQAKCSSLADEQRVTSSAAERERAECVEHVRKECEEELRQMRETHLLAIQKVQEQSIATHQQTMEEQKRKDELLQRLQVRHEELEIAHNNLASEHRILERNSSACLEELKALEEANQSLKKEKTEALEGITSKDLMYATLSERLTGVTATLDSKSRECDALRSQLDTQKTLSEQLTLQNEQLSVRVDGLEKDVAKAHYIISNQMRSLTSSKDRLKIALEQLKTLEALQQEGHITVARLTSELSGSEKRMEEVQEKNMALQQQLEQTGSANEKLSEELKQLREAMIQLQKGSVLSDQYRRSFTRSTSFEPSRVPYGRYSSAYGSADPSVELRTASSYRPPQTVPVSAGAPIAGAGLPAPSFSVDLPSGSPTPHKSSQDSNYLSHTQPRKVKEAPASPPFRSEAALKMGAILTQKSFFDSVPSHAAATESAYFASS